MGWLNSEKPPSKWSPAYFMTFVERLRTAVNALDSNNFPEGLSGVLLSDSSVGYNKLSGMGFLTKLKDLAGLEIPNIAFAVAEPFVVNSTTLVNVGGYIFYDDVLLISEHIKLIFEVTGASYDATSTATFELHGVDGKLAEVTTNTGQLEWKRSEPFVAPTGSQTLLVKAKTSDALKPAGVLSAKLIIKIGG
jgi:hypothetical protein